MGESSKGLRGSVEAETGACAYCAFNSNVAPLSLEMISLEAGL